MICYSRYRYRSFGCDIGNSARLPRSSTTRSRGGARLVRGMRPDPRDGAGLNGARRGGCGSAGGAAHPRCTTTLAVMGPRVGAGQSDARCGGGGGPPSKTTSELERLVAGV